MEPVGHRAVAAITNDVNEFGGREQGIEDVKIQNVLRTFLAHGESGGLVLALPQKIKRDRRSEQILEIVIAEAQDGFVLLRD
jgi:hypothetical protein